MVVDGCRDGSLDLLERLASQDSRLVPVWQENAGEGRARQAGAEVATGDVIVLLDDDVVAEAGLVSGHLAYHDGDRRRIVVGYMPTHLPVRRAPGQAASFLYSHDYESVCALYESSSSEILRSLWAGNMSLRRETALAMGLAGNSALGYHQDREFGFRCLRAGLEPIFDRQLRSSHSHLRSTVDFAAECHRQGAARVDLAREYPDLVALEEVHGVSKVISRVCSLIARLRLGTVAAAVLLRVCGITGRMHWWHAETFVARVLRQVELSRGILERSKVLSES